MDAPDLPVAALPATPTLRPGFIAVRRDAQCLQIGLDPPMRVIAADTPDVRQVLAALRACHKPQPRTPRGAKLVADLLACELIVDADPRGVGEHLVEVYGESSTTEIAQSLLAEFELRPSDGEVADVVLVVSDRIMARDQLDDLMRFDQPHVMVSATSTGVEVGPFVVPGTTCCLRCVDAARSVSDPRRALVLEQLSARVELADACDRPTLNTGLRFALADVAIFLRGGTPLTWSATLTLGLQAPPLHETWPQHQHCGCSWQSTADRTDFAG